MKTRLSVNLNKIALLRNSRGRNYPNLLEFANMALDAGADGITVHPRPDQRHAKYADVEALSGFIPSWPHAELNVEGYPDEKFLQTVIRHGPHQVTLVPDAPDQLTSDHGWDLVHQGNFISEIVARLKSANIRCSLFMDPDPEQIDLAADTGVDRIELYTESYALKFGTPQETVVLEIYREAALHAQSRGLGVNAGHDLNLVNLGKFLEIPGILEVSIGHALTVESLEYGFMNVIEKYHALMQSTQG